MKLKDIKRGNNKGSWSFIGDDGLNAPFDYRYINKDYNGLAFILSHHYLFGLFVY